MALWRDRHQKIPAWINRCEFRFSLRSKVPVCFFWNPFLHPSEEAFLASIRADHGDWVEYTPLLSGASLASDAARAAFDQRAREAAETEIAGRVPGGNTKAVEEIISQAEGLDEAIKDLPDPDTEVKAAETAAERREKTRKIAEDGGGDDVVPDIGLPDAVTRPPPRPPLTPRAIRPFPKIQLKGSGRSRSPWFWGECSS